MLLSDVFGTYLPPIYPYAVYGGDRLIKGQDFSDVVDVIPVADPNIFSMTQRVTLAQTQLQIAQSAPELHNIHEAYRRVYTALGTKDIDTLLKPDVKDAPTDPAIENAKALRMKIPVVFPTQNHDAHIFSHVAFVRSRMVQVNPAVYALLQSHISEHISFKARAQIMVMLQNEQPELLELSQRDPLKFEILTESMVAERVQALTEEIIEAEIASQGPDPIMALKQQELDLRAMDMQRRAGEFNQVEDRKRDEFEQNIDLDKMKREDAEKASKERIRVADEKLDIAAKKVTGGK